MNTAGSDSIVVHSILFCLRVLVFYAFITRSFYRASRRALSVCVDFFELCKSLERNDLQRPFSAVPTTSKRETRHDDDDPIKN